MMFYFNPIKKKSVIMGLTVVFVITLIIIGFSNCEGDKSEEDNAYNQCVWRCSNPQGDYNKVGGACVSSCMNFTHMSINKSNCDELPRNYWENHMPAFINQCNKNVAAPKVRDWIMKNDEGLNSTGIMITLSTCNKEINWEKWSFMVLIQEYDSHLVNLNSNQCFHATLPKIKPGQVLKNEADYRFNFVIDQALAFDRDYRLTVVLKPENEAELFMFKYHTKSCYSYNSDSCLCKDEGIQFPETTESHFEGYSIRFKAPLAPPCFTVFKYEIHLMLYKDNLMLSATSQLVTHVVDMNQTREEYDQKPYLELEFDSMFEPKGEWKWGVKVQVVDGHPWFRLYKDLALSVKNWHPSAPTVEIVDMNDIKISFKPAPYSYRIKYYWLLVSMLGDYLTNTTDTKTTYYKEKILAPNISGVDVTKTLHCLKPGHYSVEIREFRPNVDIDLITKLQSAPWSEATIIFTDHPLKNDCAPAAISGEIATLVITSVIAITLSLVVMVTCFYVWKKGLCYKMSNRLPPHMSKWLDLQTFDNVSMHSCTIWLIWQNDNRSVALREAHTENIRHFCSYLVSVCGINVIVDLFEEEEVIRGYTDWIQGAYERAEYVIFVCPHQDVSSPGGDQLHSSTVGNFVTSYLYLESLISNKKKYITVLFPYADADATVHGRWLKNVTINYRMMNDIEAFYFHLQGKSRMFINGRRSVEYISNRDFHKTNEGAALLKGFQHFAKLSSIGSSQSNICQLTINRTSSSAVDVGGIDEKTPLNMIEQGDGISSSELSIKLEESSTSSRNRGCGSSADEDYDDELEISDLGKIIPPDSIQVVYHKLNIVPPKISSLSEEDDNCFEDEI